jgi:hypothetical protein
MDMLGLILDSHTNGNSRTDDVPLHPSKFVRFGQTFDPAKKNLQNSAGVAGEAAGLEALQIEGDL